MKSRPKPSQFYKSKQKHGRQESLLWNIDIALICLENHRSRERKMRSEREEEKWNSQKKNRGYIGLTLMTLYYNDNGKLSCLDTEKGFQRQKGKRIQLTGRWENHNFSFRVSLGLMLKCWTDVPKSYRMKTNADVLSHH